MNMSGEMQELIDKIDRHFGAYPKTNHVAVQEGRLKRIEDLLYELKGLGVIGLFDSTNLQIGKKGEPLEDMIYFFDVDRERLEEFKSGKLSSEIKQDVIYYLDRATISWANREIKIEPDSRQAYLLSYVFKKKINSPISWDILYEEVVGRTPNEKNVSKESKIISDIVRAINRKIQAITPSIKLLEWRGKSVYRLL